MIIRNIEKHRTYIGTQRCDIDYSAKYAAMEDQFIQIATKDKEFTYKLTGAEKVCLDSYMAARNNKLLFSKGSVDVNGKSTLHDEIGRPRCCKSATYTIGTCDSNIVIN